MAISWASFRLALIFLSLGAAVFFGTIYVRSEQLKKKKALEEEKAEQKKPCSDNTLLKEQE